MSPVLDSIGPFALREHQREALAAVRSAREGGSSRLLVTMPPGAGKTVVGVAVAIELGLPTVVFSPNTAIQGQWATTWNLCSSESAGRDRDLSRVFTSLTYQSLATFEGDVDDSVGVVDRLHPNGQELVERLHQVGPLVVILDECHHLLEVWGDLLRQVLDSLDDAGAGPVTVLALTATPPRSLTRDELAHTQALFGPVLFEARTPALVKSGCLAPYRELAYLVAPTPTEADWLATQSERWQELRTDLLDPEFGSTPFLAWLDRRFLGERSWSEVVATEPEVSDAVLRLAHAGLLEMPAEATPAERHQHDADADDWVLLLDDWLLHCIAVSEDEADQRVLEAVRRTLPSIDRIWTRRGIRVGPGAVDRVLARSAAKQQATVEIVAAEARFPQERTRALVLCDFERATATTTRRLRDERSPDPAGSARALLEALLADPVTTELAPMMVTGSTVAAGPDTATALINHLATTDPDLAAQLRVDGNEVVGPWNSRQWVPVVTSFFAAGGTRVLVGTRGLLGEGWDAPAITTLVDLTTVTTPTAVTQTRGRALRLDPDDPAKTALIWSPVCVAEGHVSGSNDWDRFVRKHSGHFTVDEFGAVVDGVAGVDSTFSPFQPPAMSSFDELNARMLTRAQDRDRVRAAWLAAPDFDDRVRSVVRVSSRRDLALPAQQIGRLVPAAAVRLGTGLWWWLLPVVMVGGVVLLHQAWWLTGLAAVLAMVASVLLTGRTRLVRAQTATPGIAQVAAAIADGLHQLELSPVGSEAVRLQVQPTGEVSYGLDVDEQTSAVFATALAEATTPLTQARYLISRPRFNPAGADPARWARQAFGLRPDGQFWHPVPAVFAVRAARVAAYRTCWERWVGQAETVFTGSAEGAGLMVALRGTDPFEISSVIRSEWS